MLRIWVVSREENAAPTAPVAPRRRCDLEAVLLAMEADQSIMIEIAKGRLRDASALLRVEGLGAEGAWFEAVSLRKRAPREGEREPAVQLRLMPWRGA